MTHRCSFTVAVDAGEFGELAVAALRARRPDLSFAPDYAPW
jgi:hypothetical protein